MSLRNLQTHVHYEFILVLYTTHLLFDKSSYMSALQFFCMIFFPQFEKETIMKGSEPFLKEVPLINFFESLMFS